MFFYLFTNKTVCTCLYACYLCTNFFVCLFVVKSFYVLEFNNCFCKFDKNKNLFKKKKSSTDIMLSKTQLSKMIQLGGFLGRLFGLLLKTGLPLLKNVIKSLAKSVLIPRGLSAAASAADLRIHKNVLDSGKSLVKSLADSGLLLKGVSETIQNAAKEEKGVFLSILLGMLGTNLLGKILAGKGINRAGYSSKDLQSKGGKGIIRAGYRFKGFLIKNF